MATVDYKKSSKKTSTQAHLLLEIDLINKESDPANYGHKTIYLSDKYLIVEGVHYEGIVSDFGGMDMTLSDNEGIASVNDFPITLLNQKLMFMDYATDIRFSDLFSHFYFVGCTCRVYQWFEDLTLKSDALLIFTGITKQPAFNKNEVTFSIEEDSSIFRDVPINIVTLNEYPNADPKQCGLPIPVVYGNDWYYDNILTGNASIVPCRQVDQNTNKFYISKHKIKQTSIGTYADEIKIYLSDADMYGIIYAFNSSIVSNVNGAYFILGDDIYYYFYSIPKMKGSQYNCITTDYSNIVKGVTTDDITLQASELVYLKFAKFPSLGSLEISPVITIRLIVNIEAVTGASPYGTIKYYNPGYDAGAGGAPSFSTGLAITGTGLQTYMIDADKSAHGQRDDQGDQDDAWTLDDLAGYEYGITASAGCTIKVNYIYLRVGYVPLRYGFSYWQKPPYRPIKEPIKPILPPLLPPIIRTP